MSSDQKIEVSEARFWELLQCEKSLNTILSEYPNIGKGIKLTTAAKQYKNAFAAFLKRVEEVLANDHFKDIFAVAAVHGFQYKGPSLAIDIVEAKRILGKK